MKDKLPQFPSPFDAREQLVDRIGSDFYDLHEQLTTGLQVLLELHDVSPSARSAVREYVGDVVRDLARMEAGVVRLADVPGAPEAGYVLTEALDRHGPERTRPHDLVRVVSGNSAGRGGKGDGRGKPPGDPRREGGNPRTD